MGAVREQAADPAPAAEAVAGARVSAGSGLERFAPVVALQRQIGNRALRQVLARYEDAAAKKARETAAWDADEARVKAIEATAGGDLVTTAESDAGAKQLADVIYSSRRGYRVAHALVKAADAAGRSEGQIDAMFAKLGFTGLMLPSSIKAFVADGNAVKDQLFATGDGMERAKVLMRLCNKHLAKVGVPEFRDTYLGAASAEFDSEKWKLGFPDRIATLGADSMGKIIGTIYHEMRHAEQAFLRARVMAADASNTLDDIATALEMPLDLVREAKSKGAPKLNAEQLARVNSYYAGERLLIAHAPGTSDDQKDYLSRPTEHEGHLLTTWIAQYGGR
jgi:hypothetical protein